MTAMGLSTMHEAMNPVDTIAEGVQRAWPGAVAHWSSFLVIGEPELRDGQEAIAQIDLRTRCISLNGSQILAWGLLDCIPALLAHEIGHHVSYPGTLQVQARLRLLERTLVPFPEYSLVNHFTDLMINERLGRGAAGAELRRQMIRIYATSVRNLPALGQDGWRRDPLFIFYLCLYEALWDLDEGCIVGDLAKEFAEAYPHHHSHAQMLVDDLFVLGPNLYTQFLYFLATTIQYLVPREADKGEKSPTPVMANGKGCDCGEPAAADWGQAMTPTQAEKDAVRRAIEEGWFDAVQSGRLERALDIDQRASGLPGIGTEDASGVPDIMAAFYRQQAERLLFRPPALPRIGEATVPSILEDWIPGDPVREIDWLGTLLLRGEELGAGMPMKRIHEAEIEGEEVRFHQTRMEIYLDVSGSMPNPCTTLNPMTLAAQILTTATTRHGGQVRIVLYSHTPLLFWEWSRSERELSGFLMHYIGGGTEFPFDLLERSVRECRQEQPVRVIISDHDFDANVDAAPAAPALLRQATEASPGLILMQLTYPDRDGNEHRTNAYREWGINVVPITEFDNYPRVARDLAWAIYPDMAHVQ
jgi:hypothetical protein